MLNTDATPDGTRRRCMTTLNFTKMQDFTKLNVDAELDLATLCEYLKKGEAMPDITLCVSKTCLRKEGCYRHNAIPFKYRQSYAEFQEDQNGECEYFIPCKKGKKRC